jgi:hypothetical protein
MARLHTHSMFGQQYTHSTHFRHTSREDRAAHNRELQVYNRTQQSHGLTPRTRRISRATTNLTTSIRTPIIRL